MSCSPQVAVLHTGVANLHSACVKKEKGRPFLAIALLLQVSIVFVGLFIYNFHHYQ